MSLLTNLLTFIGFVTVTFGAAGMISKWLKENEERKRMLADHNALVMAALKRIELALAKPSDSKHP